MQCLPLWEAFPFAPTRGMIFGVFHVLTELSPINQTETAETVGSQTTLVALPPPRIILCNLQLIAARSKTLQQVRHHLLTQPHFFSGLAAFVNLAGLSGNAHSQPCQPETMCLNCSRSRLNLTSSLHCSFFLINKYIYINIYMTTIMSGC